MTVHSEGSAAGQLDEAAVRSVAAGALGDAPVDGKKVLVIIPDHTRSGPTGMMFRVVCETLLGRVSKLDFLIALGTHPPMRPEQIDKLVGMTEAERNQRYPGVGVFNHHWDKPEALREVGKLSVAQVEELTRGMLSMDVPVMINRMVFDYDHLIICGPVFPHEVVGFSGGHKYLFPGIAAPQIINFTHWVGALLTNPVINGTRETAVRATIEAAADLIPVERSLLAYVVEGTTVRGMFGGPVRDAWRQATELSHQVHILTGDLEYKTVLARAPEMYDDIWTAGKCMYKLEPVVADGGTLIIYAPHIDEVSYTHGKVLDEIGYHVRDYFVKQWDRYQTYPWGVVAHSTHVKGIGTFDDGLETPRVNVVLATRIPEARCKQINLGYMDPEAIKVDDYTGRESDGVLYLPKAGETLYRLNNMTKFGAAEAGR